MGDNLRPVDLATPFAILAALVLVIAASTPLSYVPVLGPLSVDEATTFVLDTPVVVSGYLADCARGRISVTRHAVRVYVLRSSGLGAAAANGECSPRRREWGRARLLSGCRTPGAPERSEPTNCSLTPSGGGADERARVRRRGV